jgi:hypothetical protein
MLNNKRAPFTGIVTDERPKTSPKITDATKAVLFTFPNIQHLPSSPALLHQLFLCIAVLTWYTERTMTSMEQIPKEWLVNIYCVQPDYGKATRVERIEACSNGNGDQEGTKESE